MATDTAVDVVMPQMGVSVSEGTITKWLKQVGEKVEADEALLEISTDKVDTEVPTPGVGRRAARSSCQEGETVEVGTKLAVIAPARAPRAAPRSRARPRRRPSPPPQAAADERSRRGARGADRAPSRAHRRARRAPAAAAGATANGKTFVSPVVARIASEHGVDSAQVPGTGRGGRVTKKDILGLHRVAARRAAPAAAAPRAAPATRPRSADAAPAGAAARAGAAAGSCARSARGRVAGETVEPMTAMRRGIAEHMRRSLDTSAHVTSAIEVDMSKVVAIREKLKKEYQAALRRQPDVPRVHRARRPSRRCATTRG